MVNPFKLTEWNVKRKCAGPTYREEAVTMFLFFAEL